MKLQHGRTAIALLVSALALACGDGTSSSVGVGASDSASAVDSGQGVAEDGEAAELPPVADSGTSRNPDTAVADSSSAEVQELDIAANDTSAGDATAADAAPTDAPGGCDSPGCPCTQNEQCNSGFCIETAEGQACAKLCTGGCDGGQKCTQVSAPGGDVQNLCVPAFPRLCEPCSADSDCSNVLGGAESRCVPYPGEGGSLLGRFCATACKADSDCASGYQCKDTTSVGGVQSKQCVRQDLTCPCDGRAVKLGLATACSLANTAGTCSGSRSCKSGSLSACDAAAASLEQCNLKDDDCDGLTDEPSSESGMCSDSNPCTYDNCIAGQCQHPPSLGACDDGSACTQGDQCVNGVCTGIMVGCDDKNPCTIDTCDAKKGCTGLPDDTALCSDGDVCTVGDTCQGGACQGGAAKPCDDLNPCTTDSCDPKKDCQFAANTIACNDGDVCSVGDVCSGGACVGVLAAPCNDGNPCTDDTCDPKKGCQNKANAAPCSDGNVCTSGDGCEAGTCVPGSTISCSDGNACTDDGCDPKKGCTVVANSAPCNDKNACTEGDACKDGACQGGEPKNCDDGNVCTTEVCDGLKGCTKFNNGEACDDGNVCSEGETCSGGSCKSNGQSACDDQNPCTTDSCDAKKGCQSQPNSLPCDDGSVCTVGDACAGGGCASGGFVVCDDGNPCTNDGCDGKSGCFQLANSAACSDGNACTSGDACSKGSCIAGVVKSCDDNNPCTDDACSAVGGCVSVNNTASCSDGSVCTGGDVCEGGSCKAGPLVPCNDGNVCTDDSCDPKKGCVFVANTAGCNDGNGCTTGDVCAAGQCSGKPGCSASAQCLPVNGAFSCVCVKGFSGDGVTCNAVCGDGVVAAGEGCDDGNTNNGDGCTGGCAAEPGYKCSGEPSACVTVCGDGVKAGSEQCDNGAANANTAGKCRTNCKLPACGDGIVDGGEGCDDGNTVAADGCSATCQTESQCGAFDSGEKKLILVSELNQCLQKLGAAFSNVQYIEVAYGYTSYLDNVCKSFGYAAYSGTYGGDLCGSSANMYPSHCGQGWLGGACGNGCGNTNYGGFYCN